MGASYDVVYEGFANDKMVMCDMGPKGHYCHPILSDEDPFEHFKMFVELKLLEEVER